MNDGSKTRFAGGGWTGAVRPRAVAVLPPEQLLPDRHPPVRRRRGRGLRRLLIDRGSPSARPSSWSGSARPATVSPPRSSGPCRSGWLCRALLRPRHTIGVLARSALSLPVDPVEGCFL